MCKDAQGVYQFVNATNVQSCINALVAQGLKVDVSAKGEVTCDLSGCDGTGSGSVGGFACSTSPGNDSPFAVGALFAAALGAGISAARRRNRKDTPS
jgi:MYXO-CTERM domain-containing protein